MWNWLAANWGNVVSLVGLVVSLYTLWLARRIRDIVEQRVSRYRRSELSSILRRRKRIVRHWRIRVPRESAEMFPTGSVVVSEQPFRINCSPMETARNSESQLQSFVPSRIMMNMRELG